MATETNHLSALLMALGAAAVLTALIIVGSRNPEHYDAALFGYTVASVVAFGAVFFRYAIWLVVRILAAKDFRSFPWFGPMGD